MLADHPIDAALPAVDLERAKRFYAEKLGLTPESEIPGGFLYRCGGDTIFTLFTSQGVASGTHVSDKVHNIQSQVSCFPQGLSFALRPRVLNHLPEAKRTRQQFTTEFLVNSVEEATEGS